MVSVSAPMVAGAKLPVLNPGKFELWKMRIEQYFLMTDYALWEVIVNGDSPPLKGTVNGVEKTYPPTTAEEKLARKNELKARGTLLMTLPNEHQLKFNTYKCAKSLLEAIEKRVGAQKDLIKPMTILQSLYQVQLEIPGETISQEDMNLKFLRSLLSEWKTHTLIWRNKPDLETLSMDDLYNNLKIYETEFKGSSSSSQNSQNMAFVSFNSFGKTNQAHGSNSANTDSMSGAVIYSFFANQSNSPQLDNEDLQQIDADNLEKMDLKWQMAMLTMRARIFLNKTRRKISTNGSETIGFGSTNQAHGSNSANTDSMSDAVIYSFFANQSNSPQLDNEDLQQIDADDLEEIDLKWGYFARECGAPRENKNIELVRRNMTVETKETKALVAQNGLGSSSSDSKSQLNVGAYKAGLEFIEARLDVYKKNEAVFEEDIKILKLDVMLRDNALTKLRKKFEKAKKERDDLKLTLEKFKNSSKNLSKLLEIQVSDKFKTGEGYDSQVFDSKDDYVFSEFVTSVPAVVTSESKTSELKPKSVSEPLIEDWISDSEDENETEFKSKQGKSSFAKVEFVKYNEHVKSPRESVKKV
ncbi:hypothetical protein Tco_1218173 [Tanacetum coccineum]